MNIWKTIIMRETNVQITKKNSPIRKALRKKDLFTKVGNTSQADASPSWSVGDYRKSRVQEEASSSWCTSRCCSVVTIHTESRTRTSKD